MILLSLYACLCMCMCMHGFIGSQSDLSGQGNLQAVILAAFETGSEETKSAAAYALGHVTVGNMGAYLPVLLESLDSGRNEYLLLSSLKEVISCHANQGLVSLIELLRNILIGMYDFR